MTDHDQPVAVIDLTEMPGAEMLLDPDGYPRRFLTARHKAICVDEEGRLDCVCSLRGLPNIRP